MKGGALVCYTILKIYYIFQFEYFPFDNCVEELFFKWKVQFEKS